MNHISILIVDDDINKISSIIGTVKEVFSETLSISQATCVQEAIENLQNKEFHLLVTDLNMPIKYDDVPNINGGEALLKSIYKKRSRANVPMFIVGLTQFIDLKRSLNGIWNVWHYDSTQAEWKYNLRDLISHISLVKSRIAVAKIETIFVEGSTDHKYIHETISIFFPELAHKVFISSVKYGGGASWVERQLFIWAKSLSTREQDGAYLKAVGLFDDDPAGEESITHLRDLIKPNSAESNTFSVLKASNKYSPLLKNIKAKGIQLKTSIEDLVSIDCWKVAESNGWLEKRKLGSLTADNICFEKLQQGGFSAEEILLITKTIKDDHKVDFCNLALKHSSTTLINMRYMVVDILRKLKISADPATTSTDFRKQTSQNI